MGKAKMCDRYYCAFNRNLKCSILINTKKKEVSKECSFFKPHGSVDFEKIQKDIDDYAVNHK